MTYQNIFFQQIDIIILNIIYFLKLLSNYLTPGEILFFKKKYWIFITPIKNIDKEYILNIQFIFEFINNIQIFFNIKQLLLKYLYLKYLYLKYLYLKLKLKFNLLIRKFYNKYLNEYFNEYFFDYIVDILFSKNKLNKLFKFFFLKLGITRYLLKYTFELIYLNLLKLYNHSYYLNFMFLKIYLNNLPYKELNIIDYNLNNFDDNNIYIVDETIVKRVFIKSEKKKLICMKE